MTYRWRSHTRAGTGIPPEEAGAQLSALRARDGVLTPAAIVDDARPDAAPLHPAFEWDDGVAAEEYRRVQAREVCRALVVVRDDAPEKPPLRAFVHVTDAAGDSVYQSLAVVMQDADLRDQVVQRAWQELESFRRRYEAYAELAAACAAIERVQAEAGALTPVWRARAA